MKMPARHLLLSGICVGIVLTIGKLLIDPTTSQREYTALSLPQTLLIPTAQLIEARSIQSSQLQDTKYNQVLAGQQYRYRQQGIDFQLELRDVVNTEGDVNQLVQDAQDWQDTFPEFQQVETAIGSYHRFVYQDKIYLTSCLMPEAKSVVTSAQFRSQLYSQLWQADRLWNWAIGRASLLENRCLWVQLSAPVGNSLNDTTGNSQSDVEQLLEEQWRSIVSWWRS